MPTYPYKTVNRKANGDAILEDNALALTKALHDAPGKASLAIAGAGNRAVGWILGVAGASRTVLDVQIPYAASAMSEYLGEEPSQFVSAETAKALARAAYFRAARLRDGRERVVGVGCSATIATDRPKRGEHRCHVATHRADGGAVFSLTLEKGLRSREGEDAVVSALTLNALAEALGVGERVPLGLSPNERVEREGADCEDALAALAAGHIAHALIEPDGAQAADVRIDGGGVVLMAGSFNPMHEGHWKLALAAAETLGGGRAPLYELSITNVDKPQLDLAEVRRRLSAFAGRAPVLATRATTFREKANLIPTCAFAIGFDTMERLVDTRYYGGSEARMMSALLEMRAMGCKFAVGGRATANGFKTLRDGAVPPPLADMFIAIPESAFREDVSSTAIRAR